MDRRSNAQGHARRRMGLAALLLAMLTSVAPMLAPAARAGAPEPTDPSGVTDAGVAAGGADSVATGVADSVATGVAAGVADGVAATGAVVPLPVLPPIDDPTAASARLIPVPSKCAAPAQEQAVFVGTLVVHDVATARFIVGRVRSGSLTGFAVAGLVDVHYGAEARFLEPGRSYLIGAAVDPVLRVLASTLAAPAPRFGGNEVAGVDNSDVDCPSIDDPVRTLQLDGTSVDSGLLTPLRGAGHRVLRAILQPVGVALLVLVGLVGLKLLVFAVGRNLRSIGDRPARDPLTRR